VSDDDKLDLVAAILTAGMTAAQTEKQASPTIPAVITRFRKIKRDLIATGRLMPAPDKQEEPKQEQAKRVTAVVGRRKRGEYYG
jgi:hypothetical protein